MERKGKLDQSVSQAGKHKQHGAPRRCFACHPGTPTTSLRLKMASKPRLPTRKSQRGIKGLQIKLPRERGICEAIWELLVSGQWLHAHTVYDDYPDEPGKDAKEFISAQTNIALLAALMLTVLADMMFTYGNMPTFVGLVLNVLMWTSTLLFFMSCTWSVFLIMCLTQADTEEEADILLVQFGFLAAVPVRQWVCACLILAAALAVWFLVPVVDLLWPPEQSEYKLQYAIVSMGICVFELLIVAVYIIVRVAQLIQTVYRAKRYFKRRTMNFFNGSLADEYKVLDLSISVDQIQTCLDDLKQRVGYDHMRLDMFLRFLYSKHAKSPEDMVSSGVMDASLATQRFSDATQRLAKRMYEKELEDYVTECLAREKVAA